MNKRLETRLKKLEAERKAKESDRPPTWEELRDGIHLAAALAQGAVAPRGLPVRVLKVARLHRERFETQLEAHERAMARMAHAFVRPDDAEAVGWGETRREGLRDLFGLITADHDGRRVRDERYNIAGYRPKTPEEEAEEAELIADLRRRAEALREEAREELGRAPAPLLDWVPDVRNAAYRWGTGRDYEEPGPVVGPETIRRSSRNARPQTE